MYGRFSRNNITCDILIKYEIRIVGKARQLFSYLLLPFLLPPINYDCYALEVMGG